MSARKKTVITPKGCERCEQPIPVRNLGPARYRQARFCGGVCAGKSCPPRPLVPMAERFWAKVKKTETCWLWTGAVWRGNWPYGLFNKGGVSTRAHRVSYEIANGSIPDGMFVCHRCDNPRCVRPEHLFLGTPQDNTDDMILKGRHMGPRGESCGNARLKATDIIQIRALRESGALIGDLAQKFNVAKRHMEMILAGTRWAHVR